MVFTNVLVLFLMKKKIINKNLLKNIGWLKNKNEFLKWYNEIIKKGEFTGTANKKVISSIIFKDFVEDILTENIYNNNFKEKYKERPSNVEKELNKSKMLIN